MQLTKRYKAIWIVALLPLTLTGCMVGPDFHTPAKPSINRYTSTPLPKKTASTNHAGSAGKAQRFTTEADIPAEWWQVFHSPVLNDLITKGLAHSPNLVAAQATLRQSQELLNAQIGSTLFPMLNATLGGQRERSSGASFGNELTSTIFNIFNASVNISYTPDVFGGFRREIESLAAQVDYQQFQLIASYLTITTNIVTTAINIASLEGQIKATKQLIQQQTDQLFILQKQFRLGGASTPEVLSQQTLLDQTRAKLPPLEKNLSLAKHALAVLVGEYPNEKMPSFSFKNLSLPANLPVSLPSSLVQQRPDVRAAEALLHSANAQVGVATANLFPQFPLTASFGWSASVPSHLFKSTTKIWNYDGQMTAPVFQGGALIAQRRAAIAAYQVAQAQYQQTVLQAFQNVADSLRAIQQDARTFRALKQAEDSALRTLTITKEQYRLGAVSYLNLLTAQGQYQVALINRIQGEALRFADTAALFQALGGGWWNKNTAKCNDPINPTHASLTNPA